MTVVDGHADATNRVFWEGIDLADSLSQRAASPSKEHVVVSHARRILIARQEFGVSS
jgi:hypothetical protein